MNTHSAPEEFSSIKRTQTLTLIYTHAHMYIFMHAHTSHSEETLGSLPLA